MRRLILFLSKEIGESFRNDDRMEYSVGSGTKLTEVGVEVPLPRGSEKVPARQPGDANFG